MIVNLPAGGEPISVWGWKTARCCFLRNYPGSLNIKTKKIYEVFKYMSLLSYLSKIWDLTIIIFLCTIPLIFIFKGRRLCFQLFRLVAAQPQLFCSHHPKTLGNNLLYFRLDYEVSNCMTRYMIGQLSTWGSWKSKSPTIWNRVAVFCSLKMFILPTW